MQKITTFLWFDGQAEEAANFYCSVFKNSKINNIIRYGEAGPGPVGSVMLVNFELEGQAFIALNGNPEYPFSLATSLYVNCETQEEVDQLWDKLTEGGKPIQCGWLTDKYGMPWQVIPEVLTELIQDKDPEKAKRVMEAMMQMVKIDIKKIQDAYQEVS
jgi:predicted 3-demethylubiquinone-9 3-methyltransferase (glyoxalase superfamily)